MRAQTWPNRPNHETEIGRQSIGHADHATKPAVSPRTTLGGRIRERRVELGLSLRELARRRDITPSYLSDIENDRRVPAEEVLRAIGKELDLAFDELTGLAGRIDQQTEEYLRRQPTAATLFRRMRERGMGQADIEKLIEDVDRRGKARSRP